MYYYCIIRDAQLYFLFFLLFLVFTIVDDDEKIARALNVAPKYNSHVFSFNKVVACSRWLPNIKLLQGVQTNQGR